MSSDSDVYSKAAPWGKRAGTAAFLAALLLPVLGACGQKATPDRNADAVTMLRFFEHDTQQATLDLGPQGTGPGDQFIYAGDLFDHAGGRQVGHTAGQCTTFSGNATAAGDVLCTATFVLDRGQITMQGGTLLSPTPEMSGVSHWLRVDMPSDRRTAASTIMA
jgi:hypothetical protein